MRVAPLLFRWGGVQAAHPPVVPGQQGIGTGYGHKLVRKPPRSFYYVRILQKILPILLRLG